MVREARAVLGDASGERGLELLHVTAVLGEQHLALDLVADLVPVAAHLRTLDQHLFGDRELVLHDRGRTLFLGELDADFPAHLGHLARHAFGELERFGRAVFHAQHGERGAQAQEAHAMAAFMVDFVALLRERQAVDLDHVVEHAGKDRHHLAILLPVEMRAHR